jgi:hypothetical protein
LGYDFHGEGYSSGQEICGSDHAKIYGETDDPYQSGVVHDTGELHREPGFRKDEGVHLI